MSTEKKLEKATKRVLDLYYHRGIQIPMGVCLAKIELGLTTAEAVAVREDVKSRI